MTELQQFMEAYIACALWSSTDSDDAPLDEQYSIEHIAPLTLVKIAADCRTFYERNSGMIGDRAKRAGHDFWLTRNGHGAGFWDGDWPENGDALTAESNRAGECDLYVGDDGKLYT